jgi:hypothetical protein
MNQPAYPMPGHTDQNGTRIPMTGGMTLQQYAAITLKVPNSGDADIDEMIRKSLLNDFAATVMPAVLADLWSQGLHVTPIPPVAVKFSYGVACEMLKAIDTHAAMTKETT